MTSPFKLTCQGNSLVKVPVSYHMTNKQIAIFVLNLWSINSQEISKWVIYTLAAGAIGGHFKDTLKAYLW